MTDQVKLKTLNCRTEGCDGTSANDLYWNVTFSVCKECYDQASGETTRALFTKWKAAKDAEQKALQGAQAKGMIILMCERIKINKKKGYLRQCIFVKWVIISPFHNLLIDRNKSSVKRRREKNKDRQRHPSALEASAAVCGLLFV